jgi:hypothetical protein
MARTGLLVSAHTGELANVVFLPAHAAVIELFPFGLRSARFRNLAPTLDLIYESLPMRAPPQPSSAHGRAAAANLWGENYFRQCGALNVSGFDALTLNACRQASLASPVLVDIARFAPLVADALEAIGAFSLMNPEWKAEAARAGVAAPSMDEYTARMEAAVARATADAEAAAAAAAAAA